MGMREALKSRTGAVAGVLWPGPAPLLIAGPDASDKSTDPRCRSPCSLGALERLRDALPKQGGQASERIFVECADGAHLREKPRGRQLRDRDRAVPGAVAQVFTVAPFISREPVALRGNAEHRAPGPYRFRDHRARIVAAHDCLAVGEQV